MMIIQMYCKLQKTKTTSESSSFSGFTFAKHIFPLYETAKTTGSQYHGRAFLPGFRNEAVIFNINVNYASLTLTTSIYYPSVWTGRKIPLAAYLSF